MKLRFVMLILVIGGLITLSCWANNIAVRVMP